MFEIAAMMLGMLQAQPALPRLPARDSLALRLTALEDRLDGLAQARRESAAAIDTLERGPMRLLVERGDRAAGEAALGAVAAEWPRLFGSRAPRVELRAVRRSGNLWDPGLGLRVVVAPDTVPAGTAWIRLDRLGRLTSGSLRTAIRAGLGSVLFQRADSSLRRWLEAPPTPSLEDYETADLYYQLATTRDPAGRACFEGEAGTCLPALGLGGDGARVTAGVRHSFFAYALSAGGPGAWTRLVAEPGAPMTRRLEAAAGQPIDRVVAGWQTWRTGHRPRAIAGELVRWLTAASWVGIGLVAAASLGARR